MDCMEKLPKRRQKCINRDGMYGEHIKQNELIFPPKTMLDFFTSFAAERERREPYLLL